MFGNYWLDVPGDTAVWGNGLGEDAFTHVIDPPSLDNTDATRFSDIEWPSTGTHFQWGIGASDGSGNGTYWKDLGSYGGDYPKLWYEE
jgi:hypothetical protein